MIKTLSKLCLVFLLGCSLASCGFIPHDVTIEPDLPVEESNIGKDKTMLVNVQDARPKQIIGYRTYMKTGNITLDKEQDLTKTIKTSIEKGFSTLGFTILQKGKPDRDLFVDISLIEYESTYGFFTVGSYSRGTFQVECKTPSGQTFKNIYRVEDERRLLFISLASSNEKWINEAVSEALMRMFNDNDFLDFLENAQ